MYLLIRKYNYKLIKPSFYVAYHTDSFQDAIKKKEALEVLKEDNVEIKIVSYPEGLKKLKKKTA
jgi:hypothetical protein